MRSVSPAGPGAGEPRQKAGSHPEPRAASPFPSNGRCHVPRGMAGQCWPCPGAERRGNPRGARCRAPVCAALAAAPLPATRGCVWVAVHAGVACSLRVRGQPGRCLPLLECAVQEGSDVEMGAPAGRQLRGSGQCPSCPPELPPAVLGGTQAGGLPRGM